ncbi:hypothetical protein D4764_09G0000320 [Takifugu flavidus]|uniref:Uncharacterized protein n=1 Tax=Takifugu flavidus TaxID=433684 RepID=A0A5C6MJG7_9TELE|nr:hypothetical protein D4764_09G0000320 [Takifugu flavidus]
MVHQRSCLESSCSRRYHVHISADGLGVRLLLGALNLVQSADWPQAFLLPSPTQREDLDQCLLSGPQCPAGPNMMQMSKG